MVTKLKVYCGMLGGYKTIIETLPVETIEWMKHQRTTVVHKLEHTQKGYMVDG
jgi:hypothetical protein